MFVIFFIVGIVGCVLSFIAQPFNIALLLSSLLSILFSRELIKTQNDIEKLKNALTPLKEENVTLKKQIVACNTKLANLQRQIQELIPPPPPTRSKGIHKKNTSNFARVFSSLSHHPQLNFHFFPFSVRCPNKSLFCLFL